MAKSGARESVGFMQVFGGVAVLLGVGAIALWVSAYNLERHNRQMIAEGVQVTASVADARETAWQGGRGSDNYTHDLVLRWKSPSGEQLESWHSVSGEIYALAVSQTQLEISYVPGRPDLQPFILAEKSGPALTQGLIGLCLFAMAAAFGAAWVTEARLFLAGIATSPSSARRTPARKQ